MRNVRFKVRLQDGAVERVHASLNGRDLIDRLVPGGWQSPPMSLAIEAITVDRQLVSITIPYGDVDQVHATVSPAPPFQNGDCVRHLNTGAHGIVLSCSLQGPALVKVGHCVESWGVGEMRLE